MCGKVVLFLLLGIAAGVSGGDLSISGDGGVAPTTMGTIGESLRLQFSYNSLVFLDMEGHSGKYLNSATDLIIYGHPAFGNISRDTLEGSGVLGFHIPLGMLFLGLDAGVAAEQSQGYTIVRLIEKNLGLPEDTSRFMDVSTSESVREAFGQMRLRFSWGEFQIALTGKVAPWTWWHQESSRFLSGLVWPLGYPSGITYPSLYWSVRKELLDLRAHKYTGKINLQWDGSVLGFYGFGTMNLLEFTGVTDIVIQGTVPYKTGDGVTPVENLPLRFLHTQSLNAAALVLQRSEFEAGAGMKLWFLKNLVGLNYPPELQISYNISTRNYLYDYLEDRPDLSAEKWTEVYTYFRIQVSLGLASP